TNLGNNTHWGTGGGILTTWQGTTTDWFNAANWNNGVPTSLDKAIIGSASAYPVLTSSVNVSTLTINAGSTITLAGFNLTVTSFTNAGNLSFKGTEQVSSVPSN